MKVKEPSIHRDSSITYQNEEKNNNSLLAGEDRTSFNTGKSDVEEKLREHRFGLMPNK